MQIVIVSLSSFFGGGEVYLRNFISFLLRNSLCVSIDIVSANPRPFVEFIDELNHNTIPVSVVRVSASYLSFPLTAGVVNGIIGSLSNPVILLNGTRPLYLAPILANRGKMVWVQHMLISTNEGSKRFVAKMLMRLCSRRVTTCVTISDYHKQDLVKNHIIPTKKVQVIHNGADIERFFPVVKQSSVNELRVAMVARLEKHKGHRDLLIAVRGLVAGGLNIKVLFLGEGSFRSDLVQLVADLGLDDRISMLGFCRDTISVLRMSDVVVLPSYDEGLPLSLLEAMALALPVVATDISGIPELIQDGINGYLISPGDVSSLAGYISSFYFDLSLRVRLGQSARATIIEKFNESTQFSKLVEVLS